MLKITIAIDSNVFEIEGEAPFADVRPLIQTWLEIQQQLGKFAQPQIDALVARLHEAHTKLSTAVDAATP